MAYIDPETGEVKDDGCFKDLRRKPKLTTGLTITQLEADRKALGEMLWKALDILERIDKEGSKIAVDVYPLLPEAKAKLKNMNIPRPENMP